MDSNTIVLWYWMYDLVKEEGSSEEVQKGDSIWGCDALPIEIKRWKSTEMEEAKKELAENMCHYRGYYDYDHYRHHPIGYLDICKHNEINRLANTYHLCYIISNSTNTILGGIHKCLKKKIS